MTRMKNVSLIIDCLLENSPWFFIFELICGEFLFGGGQGRGDKRREGNEREGALADRSKFS